MTDQNPSPSAEYGTVEFTYASGTRETTVDGTLRMGHWVKITIFRFYDYRKAALAGITNMGNLSGEIAKRGIFSGVETQTTLPLYGAKPGPGTQAFESSARGQDVDSPVQVWTIASRDETQSKGSGYGYNEVVGTVTRVTTQKSMTQPAGRFTIQAKVFGEWTGKEESTDGLDRLGLDNSIHKYVDSGDWVEIMTIKSDPRTNIETTRTMMVGKVDSVSLTINTTMSGGATVQIEGRDIGGVFEDIPLYFNPYDPAHNNALGIQMSKMIHDISGSPDEIVLMLLGLSEDESATYGMPPIVPDAGLWTNTHSMSAHWSDVWDTSFVDPMRGMVFSPNLLTPGQYTPLWDFTRTYGVPEFNEWFMDTNPIEVGPLHDGKPRRAYLFGREKPFVNAFDGDDSNWFFLMCHVVNVQEVISVSLTRGGAERYNHINVLGELPANISQDIVAYCKPAMNYHSILRWGLKKLDVTVSLHSIEEDSAEERLYADIKEWRDMLISWNVLNPYYYSGTVTIAGLRSDLRVGSKFLFEGGPVPFFKESPITETGEGYVPDSDGTVHGVGQGYWAESPGTATTFYIDAVNYNWAAGLNPTAQTVLTVSRGYRESYRVPHIKALYALWEEVTDGGSSQVPRPFMDAALYEQTFAAAMTDGIFTA